MLMWGFVLVCPDLAIADETPGELTFIVKNTITEQPIANVRISIKERETAAIYTVVTNAQGKVVVARLNPGLYAISLEKKGYTPLYEPSIRVVTRKNIKVEFALKEDSVEVVEVRTQQTNLSGSGSSIYLNREALRSAVGGADPLLSLDGLPGLASESEFASFSVRGRGPRDNLLFVDDFPFDKAVHFDATLGEEEDVGGGGRFSIFAPNVISSAEFSPGGWNAAYGGRTASLLKLDVADGNPSPSASFRYDLAGVEVGYDGPIGVTDDVTMLISARRLNFGVLFETIDELDIGEPSLRDVIAKSFIPLNDKHSLEVLLIDTYEEYTRDVFNVFASPNIEDAALLDFEQGSDLLGLTLNSLMSNDALWANRLYYRVSDKKSSEGEAYPDLFPEGSPATSFPVREDIITITESEKESGWRSDFEMTNQWGVFSAGLRLTQIELNYKTVLDGNWNRYVYDSDVQRESPEQRYIVLTPENINASTSEKETNYAGYIDQVFEYGDWEFGTGLRWERDGFADESFASPRLSVQWQPNQSIRYFASTGLFRQSPRYLQLAANESNDLKTEKITHGSVGVKYYPSSNWAVLTELYTQNLDNLVVDLDRASGTFANLGEGRSYGLDIVANGTIFEGLYATASYSYNDAVVDRKDGRGEVAADFSRKHVATLGLTWEINDRWKVAGRYKYLSGRPDDEFVIHANVLGPGEPLRFSKNNY